MRVAVLAATAEERADILEALAEDETLQARTVTYDSNLSDFEVLIASGVGRDELEAGGPPTVLIQTAMVSRSFVLPRGRIHAVLPPDFTPGELVASVRAAAAELTVLTDDQVRQILGTAEAARAELPLEGLTPRETEVLRMVADGLGNKEIAARLKISEHTAKFHVAQILAKLHAGSRAEAVVIGIRRGLIPI